IDDRSVGLEPAIGDTKHEPGAHHALDVDAVDDLLDVGEDRRRDLDLAEPERPPLAGRAQPTKEETEHLPQGIEAEAAGHDRIALKVAGKEPKVWFKVEHCPYQALAVFAAFFRDFGDAVEHEHGRQRKLRALVEELTAATGQQVFIVEA